MPHMESLWIECYLVSPWDCLSAPKAWSWEFMHCYCRYLVKFIHLKRHFCILITSRSHYACHFPPTHDYCKLNESFRVPYPEKWDSQLRWIFKGFTSRHIVRRPKLFLYCFPNCMDMWSSYGASQLFFCDNIQETLDIVALQHTLENVGYPS